MWSLSYCDCVPLYLAQMDLSIVVILLFLRTINWLAVWPRVGVLSVGLRLSFNVAIIDG